jgi:hypothetical protein
MTQYYYHPDYQFIFCFPLNGQKGHSLFRGTSKALKGLNYTLKEVEDLGAKIISKSKAERIIHTKLPD